MSLKPEVVRVSGVHSVTNSSQEGDIGFPQLQLEKLFEAATVKELAQGEPYNDKKKYAYPNPNWPETDPNKYLSIENEAHFYCVRDGYCGLDGSVDHYYTKVGGDYKYNAVPPTGSWDAKLEFSDAIKDEELYSISQEGERVCIDDSYYEKKNNNYVMQTVKSYDLYIEGQQVLCDDDHKYRQTISEIEDDEGITDYITAWNKTSDNSPATTGFYLLIDEKSDINGNRTYNVRLCDLTFNSNGVTSDTFAGVLYKLDTVESFHQNNWYIKNGNKLKILSSNDMTFNTNPAESSFYLYQKLEPYTYPNTVAPVSASLYIDSGSSVYKDFNINDFPVYRNATVTEIPKTSHASYTIYEKTAVKTNYNYSNNNSLKFIFTDKDIDGVLTACNLPNDIKKYVHLTNLRYNKN